MSPVERRPLYVGLAALAAILVAAIVIAVVISGTDRNAGHVVSAPREGRHSAVLDLVSGAGEVTVRSKDLGDQLYRISTPDGTGQVPRVDERDDVATVRLHSVAGDGDGQASVEILLSSAVTWTVRLDAGASALRMDLRDGPVAGVEVTRGVSSAELWLSRPPSLSERGTVPVRETGGAGTFAVHLPSGVPVRARLDGGAASATVDGTTRSGLPGGAQLGSSDPSGGYDIDAVGGVSTLRVDRF
jgi:hypothetical protein